MSETFWQHQRYAVVGHKTKKNFPELTYRGLKDSGKTVFAVDPSLDELDGDRVFHDLSELKDSVDGVVLEVPNEETRDWIKKAADLGIKDVWIHMNRDTPEALALAEERLINARHGTCAVMYVTPGFTARFSARRVVTRSLKNPAYPCDPERWEDSREDTEFREEGERDERATREHWFRAARSSGSDVRGDRMVSLAELLHAYDQPGHRAPTGRAERAQR